MNQDLNLKLFAREADGTYMMYEVNKSKAVPPEMFVESMRVTDKKRFAVGGRQFSFSTYAKRGQLIHSIWCSELKWSAPLKYNKENDTFIIDNSGELAEVYMRDINVIATVTDGGSLVDYYMINKAGKTPYLTNIHPGGRVCIDIPSQIEMPPQNIIAMLESTKGNHDLNPGGNYGGLTLEDGKIFAKPRTEGNPPNNLKPYIRNAH